MKDKILYAITLEDAKTVSGKNKDAFTEQDLRFLSDKVGDFFGDHWHSAVEYALEELERSK